MPEWHPKPRYTDPEVLLQLQCGCWRWPDLETLETSGWSWSSIWPCTLHKLWSPIDREFWFSDMNDDLWT